VTDTDDGAVATPSLRHGWRMRRRPTVVWLIEWFVVLVVALVAALLMRAFVFETYFIPSGSMEPTLQIGDRIIVSKLSVEWGTIHRGDILVFLRPPNEEGECGGPEVNDLVKRVIGMPNEYLWSVGNLIYWSDAVGGVPHLVPKYSTYNRDIGRAIGTAADPVYIPPNHYFMMGDNEDDSCDSRYWGSLPGNLVVGKVVLRIWPLSRFDFL
jgi:signal peptidase I